jgi:hypothetical protein
MNTQSENSPEPRPSFFSRLIRWMFSWRTLRRALLILAGLFTLVALFFAEENWRGKRAWEKFKREWEAKGERFDLAAFLPKPVPDDQNFVMTPFFAPLLEKERKMAAGNWKDTNVLQSTLDVYGGAQGTTPSFGGLETAKLTDLQEWQKFYRSHTNLPSAPQPQAQAKDVLLALARFGPVLNELRDASRRPYAVFPLYQEKDPMFPVIHLSNLKSITTVLRLRAVAFLADGQSREALEDVKLSLRLADSLKPEPFLISHLVRIAILSISANSVWEGLARHRWSEAELAELQQLLGSIDLLADYEHVLRGERAFGNAMLARLRRGQGGGDEPADSGMQGVRRLIRVAPTGLLYQNQLRINQVHQLRTLPAIDAGQHRVYSVQSDQLANAPEIRKATPYNILARLLFPAFGKSHAKTARAQVSLDQATVACAAERFRIANGQYPEKLEALVPRFLEKIPTDVINGKPLGYRRSDDGQFVLYSVGWNQKDDGGQIVFRKGTTPRQDADQGDWVWSYPAGK